MWAGRAWSMVRTRSPFVTSTPRRPPHRQAMCICQPDHKYRSAVPLGARLGTGAAARVRRVALPRGHPTVALALAGCAAASGTAASTSAATALSEPAQSSSGTRRPPRRRQPDAYEPLLTGVVRLHHRRRPGRRARPRHRRPRQLRVGAADPRHHRPPRERRPPGSGVTAGQSGRLERIRHSHALRITIRQPGRDRRTAPASCRLAHPRRCAYLTK